MKGLLVITDSYRECEKAVKVSVELKEKLGIELEILAVLEDVYNLEKSSVSLGMPVPPNVKEESVSRMKKHLTYLWEKYTNTPLPEVHFQVGPIHEEVKKFLQNRSYDLLIWACYPTHILCKTIDDINVSSFIIK